MIFIEIIDISMTTHPPATAFFDLLTEEVGRNGNDLRND